MQNNEQPSAMKIRQNIQEFMTYTITDKEFNEDDVELINVDIELDNLDWVFHNYKIINLTDIHIGQWIQPEYLDNLVEYINTLNSDMIVLTGDYVSYILDGYENDLEKSLKKLKAKDAKLAVLGNHDHWMGAEKIRKIPVHEGSAMTDQAASARLELLVFSDDATVRQEVIDGVGRRPAKGLPLVSWTEAALRDRKSVV